MSALAATGGDRGVDATAAVLDFVRGHHVSDPVDHGSPCCTAARRWLAAVHSGGGPSAPLGGLGWIADMYPWGPSQWPISWCKLVEQEKLDCGAQSAIAREVVRGSGTDLLGVQLLVRASAGDIAHWGCNWRDEGVAPTWLFDRLYYHEAVGLADDGLVVLDPTRNARVPPDGRPGDGSIVAIRVTGGEAESLHWGPHELVVGQWALLPSVDL